MEYRFPSAMGEAESAGCVFNPEYLEDVKKKAKEFLRDFAAKGIRPEAAKRCKALLDEGIVAIVLLAVQECPSGDFIIHDRNGDILKEK
jgi:hypothetical protein